MKSAWMTTRACEQAIPQAADSITKRTHIGGMERRKIAEGLLTSFRAALLVKSWRHFGGINHERRKHHARSRS